MRLRHVSINPLGAYSVESIGVSVAPQSILAAASIDQDAWSVEAAIPLAAISLPLSVAVERIRPPRPNALNFLFADTITSRPAICAK